ncbi:folylpolyglutamate synthase-like [Carica papaya]|uniref:folylpolyglutamate synthase-like n=1 Tax=Carica papaya TaxID=3649 RepID=UPI000B8C8001|nr:folylpolyglutamate synthase-like [Carica papaya]
MRILGLEEKINDLKIIHIAGTKGKGSTCTFCEAILRECGFQTGLFTSPHLIDVRERIRINGLDISEDKFLLYFWECWNLLKDNLIDGLPMPPLFQFLTVLAFKVFISEQVDVAIIEVGLGGKRDSTNVIKEPVVCGISSLGMDHTESLGNTIGQIASHKAGIFKPEVPGFTVPQLSEAIDVIQQRAHELMVSSILSDEKSMEHVRRNGYALNRKESTKESDKILKQVLLFNCMDVRDPQILLRQLVNTCASSGTHFSKALFAPTMSTYNKVTSATIIPSDIYSRDLTWQFRLQTIWERTIHGADIALDIKTYQIDSIEILPPHDFLYWNTSNCNPSDKFFACSTIIPSLPLAIKWLRDCVRENPSLQLQVIE